MIFYILEKIGKVETDMKQKVYNSHNITDGEITQETVRVKVFIINSANQIITITSNGGYQLPGGHCEYSESMEKTLIREVAEETGIMLDESLIEHPFYLIKYYVKNYDGKKHNCLSKILYYCIKTDKNCESDKIRLTEHEKSLGFGLCLVPYNEFEKLFKNQRQHNPNKINRIIADEVLCAFQELKSYVVEHNILGENV